MEFDYATRRPSAPSSAGGTCPIPQEVKMAVADNDEDHDEPLIEDYSDNDNENPESSSTEMQLDHDDEPVAN